jgi:serine protease AprX
MKFLFILLFFPVLLFAQQSGSLNTVLAGMSPDDEVLIWVNLKDKGESLNKFYKEPTRVVSERSLKRRSKVLPQDKLISYDDLPVNSDYIASLQAKGLRVKQRSRWFNSVSGYVMKKNVPALQSLACVQSLSLVAKYKSDNKVEKNSYTFPRLYKTNDTTDINYGPSLKQNETIGTVTVHASGNSGQGVYICIMDCGFTRWQTHEAFQQTHVIATWDFVNNNWGVDDSSDVGSGTHGTMTLSALGGYAPGKVIGTAYGATFILAKTENTVTETPIEEDNWIAALEWADSIGVDVTSTSLGYLTFDPPWPSLTWLDMDGNTAKITIAADLAVKKGIVVCNAAGNNGFNSQHNTLNAPADGDSVISIGAIDSLGARVNFSSVGPTIDGRIKPDVMAMGWGGNTASAEGDSSYSIGSGTSFACPLAAGGAALILHAHPDWTPIMVRTAMWNTASQHSTPDNLMGWGILNTQAAIGFVPVGVSENNTPLNYELLQNYPNPFNPSTTVSFILNKKENVSVLFYNSLGQKVFTAINSEMEAGNHSFVWNAAGLSSGIYFCELVTPSFRKTIKLMLMK